MKQKKAVGKKAYQTPKLEKIGTITELTLGSQPLTNDPGGPTGGRL